MVPVLALDPFAVIMTGLVGGLLLIVLALGLLYPGSGAAQLGWRPTRSAELDAQNEIDDLDQMLEAANVRRRRRGEAELTEAAMHARVQADRRRQGQMRAGSGAELEIAQMLDVTNAKRRGRGEPELTLAELRADLGV